MLTVGQVEALAPDASSLKAARLLADLRKWQQLGSSADVVWGLCQGSGRHPYQTQAALSDPPAVRCSCPSQKFPCKHALALLFLWSSQPEKLPSQLPPPWVQEWVERRTARQKPAKTDKPPDPEAQARRAAQRASRVEEGVAFLRHWLEDLVREGLSAAQTWPDSFWWGAAARLVDMQAGGLARMVRRIPEILGGPEWQVRLVEHLGRLHLLLEAYARLDQLSPELQAEIRLRLGWSQSQQELLQQPGVAGPWCVVGQRLFDDENLRTLRTWLWNGERAALLLDFAAGAQPLPNPWVVGSWVRAELVFYPGVCSQRALLKGLAVPLEEARVPGGSPDLATFLQHYAAALAENPWLESVPALLSQLRPGQISGSLVDAQGRALRFWPDSRQLRLLALSGGHPLTLFGEWDGHGLRPLAAWADGRCWSLEGEWTN